jgi:hypothetical protein
MYFSFILQVSGVIDTLKKYRDLRFQVDTRNLVRRSGVLIQRWSQGTSAA